MSTDVALQAAAGPYFSGDRTPPQDSGQPRPARGERGKRVAELPAQGVDVSKHLFDSGRSAVAHAGLDGVILDPDIQGDRRRIADDADVMAGLAVRHLRVEAGVPDESGRSRGAADGQFC